MWLLLSLLTSQVDLKSIGEISKVEFYTVFVNYLVGIDKTVMEQSIMEPMRQFYNYLISLFMLINFILLPIAFLLIQVALQYTIALPCDDFI